jgi:hypothetical protein
VKEKDWNHINTSKSNNIPKKWIPILFSYMEQGPLTRDYYLRRLKNFFNYIELSPEENIAVRCNYFAEKAKYINTDLKFGLPFIFSFY